MNKTNKIMYKMNTFLNCLSQHISQHSYVLTAKGGPFSSVVSPTVSSSDKSVTIFQNYKYIIMYLTLHTGHVMKQIIAFEYSLLTVNVILCVSNMYQLYTQNLNRETRLLSPTNMFQELHLHYI